MAIKKRSWLFRAIGGALASAAGFLGAYSSTDPRRKFFDGLKFQKATANEAIGYNLPNLVNQCRQLERTTAVARAIVEGFKADVIGTGIAVEPDTDDQTLNDLVRDEFNDWAESAGVDGTSLWELQAMGASEACVAGSILWRYVVLPERAKEGLLPVAVLALEPEWLSPLAVGEVAPGNQFCNGVEYDRMGRPVAYHLADPSQYGAPKGERVPAKEICHGFEKRRPFQNHGEPILAPAIERIKQEQDLVDVELHAAKNTAAIAVAITSEYHPDSVADDSDPSSEAVNDIPLGSTVRLYPGEDVKSIANNRPNQLIAAFKAVLRADIAGACRCAQKWITRDYSSSTYMNARMEQLDSKRLHKPTQAWLGRHVASRPYLEVLPWIMLKLGRPMPANPRARKVLTRHKLLPDLPEYVDPLKDGQAATENIRNNLSTLEEECAARGKDWRDVLKQRKLENDELKAAGLAFAEDAKIAADAQAKADQASVTADAQPEDSVPARAAQTENHFHLPANPEPAPTINVIDVHPPTAPEAPKTKTIQRFDIRRDEKGRIESVNPVSE